MLRFAPRTLSRAPKLRLAATLSAVALSVFGLTPQRADASIHNAATGLIVTSLAPAPGGGFWVHYDNPELFENDPFDAETIPTGGAPDLGTHWDRGTIAGIPGRNGYYIVSPLGRIYERGDTQWDLDPVFGTHLSDQSDFPVVPISTQFIVAAAAHPTGKGLWAVGRDGAVWAWGTNMQTYGDVTFDTAEPAAIVSTPSGNGYYIVMDNGGVHARGDAVFYGSTGGNRPNGKDITGMALSIGNNGLVNGYWLVGEDGGVHTFGDARFLGSTGGNNGGSEVTGIASFPAPAYGRPAERTRGYAWVHKHGYVTTLYAN